MPFRRVGQPFRISTTVTDLSGAPADPGDLSLLLRDPTDFDTTLDYNPGPIVRDGLGLFHYDANLTTPLGDWIYSWQSTGSNAGVGEPKWFRLIGRLDPVVLTLADAKRQLNITSTTNDDELQDKVDAVTDWIEELYGPITPTVETERVESSSGVLLVNKPILTLGSVTPYASAPLTLGSLVWRVGGSTIYPGTYGSFWSASSYTVVYTSGERITPPSVNDAARTIVAHIWETQRGAAGGPRPGGFGEDTTFEPGLGFAIPNRAKEMLQARPRMPAVR